jgi:hypothetical protein
MDGHDKAKKAQNHPLIVRGRVSNTTIRVNAKRVQPPSRASLAIHAGVLLSATARILHER